MLEIDNDLDKINSLIEMGEFDNAMNLALGTLREIKKLKSLEHTNYLSRLFKISGFFIDIGHLAHNEKASNIGIDLLTKNENNFKEIVHDSSYCYFLANAKSNLITAQNPFEHDFGTIEQLIEHKSLLWEAIQKHPSETPLEYKTNLANSLKQQFRIVESLALYDQVNQASSSIAQSWINRSDSLKMLNEISNSYSIQMLSEIKKGYTKALESGYVPPQYRDYYLENIQITESKIKEICKEEYIEIDDDEHITEEEYEGLSDYRKFCLDNYLSLSEHGLYCKCIGSSQDNLTIPTTGGISGDFVIPMEKLLNRIKSEFSFARKLFYDYFNEADDELHVESAYSELNDFEILGYEVEKLRTAFRLCFGILDKIGIGICEMFDLYPSDKKVYFHNFWKLSQNNRIDKFNEVNNPGLLALYSIATDLNEHKLGKWSLFKDYRNSLEHEFVVLYNNENKSCALKAYENFSFQKEIVFIEKDEFISNLEVLFQLTRSAIFSFVFSVRSEALRNNDDGDKLLIPNVIKQQTSSG
ncbi:LA2681 family HEPN domain-containing protein, partial [Pseudoalteromonas sp. MMG012]|uniref:LA2681 family HEPN domain-containing protein n=1 Tax=Pseudoalteromonas sp. MMG012 TaxID=2822686 RepID=UPI001B3A692B